MGTTSKNIKFPFVIPSGSATSNIAWSWRTFGDSASLQIFTPADLVETLKFQVSPKNSALDSDDWFDWYNDDDPAVLEVLPDPGTSRAYPMLITSGSIRLSTTSGTVAADRTIWMTSSDTR